MKNFLEGEHFKRFFRSNFKFRTEHNAPHVHPLTGDVDVNDLLAGYAKIMEEAEKERC